MIMSPILAWALRRSWGDKAFSFQFWALFLAAQMGTHIFLDGFNAYGTGWLEPFSHRRFSFNAVFVADPFFSIPLGLALLVLLFTPLQFAWRNAVATCALCLSGLYLVYGLYNKWQIDKVATASFNLQAIDARSYFTTPTPFNNWLWYVVATDPTGSHVGYRSVFDSSDDIAFEFFPKNDSLLLPLAGRPELDLLKRLSQGHYTVEARGDTLIFNDLRFGQMLGWNHPRSGFVFHYYLKPDIDNTVVLQRGRFAGWTWQTLSFLWWKIRGN